MPAQKILFVACLTMLVVLLAGCPAEVVVPDTALHGRVLVYDEFSNLAPTHAGVKVTIWDSSHTYAALTNDSGYWRIEGVPAGMRAIDAERSDLGTIPPVGVVGGFVTVPEHGELDCGLIKLGKAISAEMIGMPEVIIRLDSSTPLSIRFTTKAKNAWFYNVYVVATPLAACTDAVHHASAFATAIDGVATIDLTDLYLLMKSTYGEYLDNNVFYLQLRPAFTDHNPDRTLTANCLEPKTTDLKFPEH